MYKIKSIDRKILQLIQNKDFCVPKITKIAHELRIPASTVQSKLNKMNKEGLIKEYSVVLDGDKLNKGFVAFLLGQVVMKKEMNLDAPAKMISKIPQVQEVYFITGDWDYLVKIRVKDKEEYYEVMQKVSQYFGLRAKGMISPKCFKDSHHIQIE